MIKPCLLFIIMTLLFSSFTATARTGSFGETLCLEQGFQCHKVTRNESWSSLFPKQDERNLVKKLNRINNFLKLGMVIAVPETLDGKSIFDFSPFPETIKSYHEKTIVVNLKKLAWAAYSDEGKLIRWGPVSAGAAQCFESASGCQTPTGSYHITRKDGEHCASNSYPKRLSGEKGGAAMPYCLFFFRGYAMHGSHNLPGYHASHGCVRLFVDDAKWLFEHFAKAAQGSTAGTKVIVTSSES